MAQICDSFKNNNYTQKSISFSFTKLCNQLIRDLNFIVSTSSSTTSARSLYNTDSFLNVTPVSRHWACVLCTYPLIGSFWPDFVSFVRRLVLMKNCKFDIKRWLGLSWHRALKQYLTGRHPFCFLLTVFNILLVYLSFAFTRSFNHSENVLLAVSGWNSF